MVWFSRVTMSRSVSGGGQDGRGVEGLDGRHVQDRHVDVVGLEASRRLQGAHGHQAGGDEYDVAAGAQLGGLAELEGVVVLVEDPGNLAAQQTHVGRARGRGQGGDGLLDVHGVARVHDGEPGTAAEDGKVLGGLVAGAVAGGQAGQGAHDVDVEARLGDVEAQEVVGPTGREDRVGGGERDEPDLGEAGGGSHHRLLGHAHLEEPLGVGAAEDVHVGVLREVGRQADDLGALLGELGQRVSERRRRRGLAGVGERGDHRRGGQALLGGRGHGGGSCGGRGGRGGGRGRHRA